MRMQRVYVVTLDDGSVSRFLPTERVEASRGHGRAVRWKRVGLRQVQEWVESANRTHSGPILIRPPLGEPCGLNASIASIQDVVETSDDPE